MVRPQPPKSPDVDRSLEQRVRHPPDVFDLTQPRDIARKFAIMTTPLPFAAAFDPQRFLIAQAGAQYSTQFAAPWGVLLVGLGLIVLAVLAVIAAVSGGIVAWMLQRRSLQHRSSDGRNGEGLSSSRPASSTGFTTASGCLGVMVALFLLVAMFSVTWVKSYRALESATIVQHDHDLAVRSSPSPTIRPEDPFDATVVDPNAILSRGKTPISIDPFAPQQQIVQNAYAEIEAPASALDPENTRSVPNSSDPFATPPSSSNPAPAPASLPRVAVVVSSAAVPRVGTESVSITNRPTPTSPAPDALPPVLLPVDLLAGFESTAELKVTSPRGRSSVVGSVDSVRSSLPGWIGETGSSDVGGEWVTIVGGLFATEQESSRDLTEKSLATLQRHYRERRPGYDWPGSNAVQPILNDIITERATVLGEQNLGTFTSKMTRAAWQLRIDEAGLSRIAAASTKSLVQNRIITLAAVAVGIAAFAAIFSRRAPSRSGSA